MSLYGALFGGVSGLRAQSSKIGVISDNIANANTIGYKRGAAVFQSLVINSSSEGAYQTGGVRGGTKMNISQQGLLQSTNSSTDIAISGGGFFVVRTAAVAIPGDTSSTPYYTRAGSFTQDALGNFVNTQGYFLQGWPLSREGLLPGEPGNPNTTSFTNFDSLETVNVESASGVAQSTSSVELGANLKSSETVFPGSSGLLVPDTNDVNNRNLAADQVLVGAEYGMATTNDLRRGDSFDITINGATTVSFEYGGYIVGRDVTASTGNTGDGHVDNQATLLLDGSANLDYVAGGSTFELTIPNHGLIDGETITITNITGAKGATPAAELNATHVVDRIDGDTLRITVTTAHGQAAGPVGADPFNADVRSAVFTGNIFNSSTTGGNFLNSVTGYTEAAATFTISTNAIGTRTFTYTNSTPNAANGEFSSLTTLATAINVVDGLTARIVDGRLVVGSEDSTEAVTFANGDAAGTAAQRGLDWITELDLADLGANSERFNSLQSLADLVNGTDDISAEITNPLSSASLTIQVDSPLQTIQFDDLTDPEEATGNVTIAAATYAAGATVSVDIDLGAAPPAGWTIGETVSISGLTAATYGLPGDLPNGQHVITNIVGNVITIDIVAPVTFAHAGVAAAATAGNRFSVTGQSNQGSVLAAFGLVSSLAGTDYTAEVTANGIPTSGLIDPRYNASGTNGENMASGDITAQFSRNIRIYDAQGTGHDIRFSFIKTGTNTWAAEVHVIPETEISVQAGFVDGQIATGTVTFNGDGTLQSVSPSLLNPIDIAWTNGAAASEVTLNLGTAGALGTGLADGMSQFDSGYNVNFANQNGAPVGQLVSVSINDEGQVIASYSNGQIQSLYQLPLADFANPDGLTARSGNIFEQTSDSGEVNLREAGTNGTGTIVSAALEQSNVDLAEELTDMIVAQRAYQANTRVIRTTDELLESLNQI